MNYEILSGVANSRGSQPLAQQITASSFSWLNMK